MQTQFRDVIDPAITDNIDTNEDTHLDGPKRTKRSDTQTSHYVIVDNH